MCNAYVTILLSSQASKCSEASVILEDRNITRFEKLLHAIESISTEQIKMKKPLKKKSTARAINSVAKMIKVVLETVQPNGTSSDQIELAASAVEKLKNITTTNNPDETTTSLVEHFQNVTNKDIKRSLLGEISKKVSFPKLQQMVKNKVTLYE